MATFEYNATTDQDELVSEVERHADQELATGQTVGTNRASMYSNLVTAMRHVFNAAPREAVDKASADGSGQAVANVYNATEIELPDDFTRFMELRLADWKRDLYELVDRRSDQVRMQYNSFTAAGAHNPVATKAPDPGGASGELIRCWPQDATPTIDRFAYLPELAPEDAPEILKGAIILYATSYTLAAQREPGHQIMERAANVILRQIEAGQQPMVQPAIEQAREQTDS